MCSNMKYNRTCNVCGNLCSESQCPTFNEEGRTMDYFGRETKVTHKLTDKKKVETIIRQTHYLNKEGETGIQDGESYELAKREREETLIALGFDLANVVHEYGNVTYRVDGWRVHSVTKEKFKELLKIRREQNREKMVKWDAMRDNLEKQGDEFLAWKEEQPFESSIGMPTSASSGVIDNFGVRVFETQLWNDKREEEEVVEEFDLFFRDESKEREKVAFTFPKPNFFWTFETHKDQKNEDYIQGIKNQYRKELENLVAYRLKKHRMAESFHEDDMRSLMEMESQVPAYLLKQKNEQVKAYVDVDIAVEIPVEDKVKA